jgi:hypothetical protein
MQKAEPAVHNALHTLLGSRNAWRGMLAAR